MIPMVLSKSSLCAAGPRPLAPGPSNHVPNIPPHSLCDHIYLREGGRLAQAGGVSVAVTHRYGQKYSTTIYVTLSPFEGVVTAADCRTDGQAIPPSSMPEQAPAAKGENI